MKRHQLGRLGLWLCVSIAAGALVLTAAGCSKEEAPEKPTPQSTTQPAAAQYANRTCPIMGTEMDLDNVPASLVRDFQGKKVAFCCEDCPPKWDKLSDKDKTAKLAAAK